MDRKYTNKYGLKLPIRALAYIHRKNNLNQLVYSRDIEVFFGIKKSFVSAILSELENDGMIFRKIIRKRKQIFITYKGVLTIKKCVFSLVSNDELKILSQTPRFFN